MTRTSGLTVRQFERADVDVAVEFVVAPSHRRQVRFSPTSKASDPQTVRGRAIDISHGGMGLKMPIHLPRQAEGMLRVYEPISSRTNGSGDSVHEVIFEHEVKVRRVAMAGHEPSYSIGVAFVDPEPDNDARIHRLIEQLGAAIRTYSSGAGEEQPRRDA